MKILNGKFQTPNGAKYLKQLCNHFAHKIEVSQTESEGDCKFEFGKATISFDASNLFVQFELSDQDDEGKARDVIDAHLERFAFRENFTHMEWKWQAENRL